MADTKNEGLAADAVHCDREGCTELATLSYIWDWGEKGVCCGTHQMLLQQTAENLGGRRVSFAPLTTPGPAPLQRDERTQLIAAKLSAEAELVEVKGRGLDLYRENLDLTRQVQSLTVRGRECDAQLKQALQDATELREQLSVRDAEHGEMAAELGRLRTLAKFMDEATAPPALPFERTPERNVVDG